MKCLNCGSTQNLQQCKGDKSLVYCSRECQKEDWEKNHLGFIQANPVEFNNESPEKTKMLKCIFDLATDNEMLKIGNLFYRNGAIASFLPDRQEFKNFLDQYSVTKTISSNDVRNLDETQAEDYNLILIYYLAVTKISEEGMIYVLSDHKGKFAGYSFFIIDEDVILENYFGNSTTVLKKEFKKMQ